MSDGLILNEASLPFNSENDCEQNLQLFFSIINEANIQGVSFYRADDMEGEWSSLVYAENFVFGRWIGAISNSDRDLSLLVKNVISKVRCPLIYTKYNSLKEETKDIIFSLSTNSDIEVQGLGVASITGNYGISFSSNECWKVNPITITQQKDGVERKHINIENIHSLECLSQLLVGFQEKQQSNKAYLSSLTAQGNEHFPNLIFCKSALKDMCSSSITIYDFKNIINILNKLNEAIINSNNLNELIELSGLDISLESQETMKCGKHKRKRVFNHPTLGRSVFEEHVKNFLGGKRMHILPEYNKNIICIGYVGRHLSTKDNPNP